MPTRCSSLSVIAAMLALGARAAPAPPAPAAAEPVFTVAAKQKPYFDLIHVEDAWKITAGSPDCIIGVVDTGFDFFHPALVDQLVPGFFSPATYHTESFDTVAHGTLVASLLVAHNVEPGGMVGLAPRCRALVASQGTIMHLQLRSMRQVRAAKPDATNDEIWKEIGKTHTKAEFAAWSAAWVSFAATSAADGIRSLVDGGARVINISEFLGSTALGPENAKRLNEAFDYAIAKDVVVVMGAGNDAKEVLEYPGGVDSVLVVGASLLDDTRWEQIHDVGGTKVKVGSCYGPRLSVMAPVENLVVAQPHEKAFYERDDSPSGKNVVPFGGAYTVLPIGATSSATPMVAALAALVRSLRPDLSARDVVQIITQSAVDIGAPGVDPLTGHGRVDFAKTLAVARAWPKKKS